jgi:hypothetical protein
MGLQGQASKGGDNSTDYGINCGDNLCFWLKYPPLPTSNLYLKSDHDKTTAYCNILQTSSPDSPDLV